MNEIIFDGKWSFWDEWKQSSYEKLEIENNIIYFRIAHQDEYIYALLDFVSDQSFDKNMDYAMLCFDIHNEKSKIPNTNNFCFKSILGNDVPVTYQGGSPFGSQSNFKKISNHEQLIAIAGISDENDRYSKQPHVSYEFKIPLELINRSNNYGFSFIIYDGKSNLQISWPERIESNSILIPPPKTWGDLVSPDNSLPEFSSNLLLFFIGILLIPALLYKTSHFHTNFL